MISTVTLPERLQRAFQTTPNGVSGLVEQLLGACVGGEVEFERVEDRCVCRWLNGGEPQETVVPLPAKAFRAILARVAVLCNERESGTVSPYGGGGELMVGESVFVVRFTNTPSTQKMTVKPRH
jgi:hypothetical protein